MILRIILIAILIFIFIRISRRLISGIKEVTGTGTGTRPGMHTRREQKRQTRGGNRFDHIEDAEFEEVSEDRKNQ